jgi:hypothetical protein
VFGRHASLPFRIGKKRRSTIDAIKMLIKQVQHAKVANVLATESDTRSIPSTNDRDTTQVRELKTASNYRGTGKSLFWIQKNNKTTISMKSDNVSDQSGMLRRDLIGMTLRTTDRKRMRSILQERSTNQ